MKASRKGGESDLEHISLAQFKGGQTVATGSATLNQTLAKVVRLDPPYLWVEATRQAGGCGSCHAQSTCGTSSLAQLFGRTRTVPLKVYNEVEGSVAVGDWVLLILEESALIQHALMAYGVPLLGLFVGAFVFQALGGQVLDSEGFVVLGSALGMLAGWWGVKKWYQPILPVAKRLDDLKG